MSSDPVSSVDTRPAGNGGRSDRAAGIDIAGVGKEFPTRNGRKQVLADVTQSIRPGSFVSLVGRSGCGKSTLLMMMAGLEPTSRGQVSIGGKPVSGLTPDVGIVFQRESVFPWRRLRQNLEFGLQMRHQYSRAERSRRAQEYLELVGLGDYADFYPKDISGGMRQRLAIAQTLICEPKVLLMDEPFGALDALTRESMQDLLLRLWSEYGMTVCFVTHGIEEAVYLSDTVLVMGGSPASVRAAFEIDLPRPRGLATRESAEFAGLCGQIRRELDLP